MAKILVTGGLGLIGHNVVRLLQAQQHTVSVIDNLTNYEVLDPAEVDYLMQERERRIDANTRLFVSDIADARATRIVIEEQRPDIIVHLASFPRQKVVGANPDLAARTMMQGTLALCELAHRNKVSRLVYASSSMVYGDFQDDVREDAPCRPQGQYGIMKLAGEMLLRDYTRRGAFEHVILRPSAVYGPLDTGDRVISRFLLQAMQGRTLQVRGAQETLDFTYVDDAAAGIVAAALSDGAANRTYNITKSHSHTLLDAARLAVKIAGRGSIECLDRDQDFPSRGALNIDAARQDFGFDPKIDVEEGFQRYHDWLKNSVYWSSKTV